jgi:hypothetical protein
MSQETPLFTKTYDLLVYLLQISDAFPRSQRDLRQRIRTLSLACLDLLLDARKSTPYRRRALLREADATLDKLRYTVRASQELGLISHKQYLHAAGLVAEVGKLLGTWIKPAA